ncbi:MAG: DUF531 family protein [Candidatus Thermoplasmatota archaeon]|jgi:hypothetical protein
MRALIQESRSGAGRPIHDLLDAARSIPDASFSSEALFHLAGDSRLAAGEVGRVLAESLHLLNKVERGWRQAEVLEEMVRKAPKLRSDAASAQHVERFLSGLVDVAVQMPVGQALSKALQSFAKVAPPARRGELVAKALGNTGFALQDAKILIDASPESRKAILAIRDSGLRSRLLAHLHIHAAAGTMKEALSEAAMVPDQDRVEVYRAIVASIEVPADLDIVHGSLVGDAQERARLLAALAGRADRLGARATALAWFAEGETQAAAVPDAKARASIRSNLAQGLERAGESARSAALAALAQADKASLAANPSMTTQPPVPSQASTPAPRVASAAHVAASIPPGTRHVLALVDTYEGGLSEVHLRAVARAAPLCDAFGLDLALIGFPTDNLGALLKQAMAETNVGDGGRHIQDLVAGGHVHLVYATHRTAPDFASFGHAVATTPDPDAGKAADFMGCITAGRSAGAKRLIVLMGLGRKGLPATFLKAAPSHLELTGRNVSLETATAMGVIAERMRQLPRL